MERIPDPVLADDECEIARFPWHDQRGERTTVVVTSRRILMFDELDHAAGLGPWRAWHTFGPPGVEVVSAYPSDDLDAIFLSVAAPRGIASALRITGGGAERIPTL